MALYKTTSGKTIDTDQLGDVSAAVFEKLDEVNAFFIGMKVPYLLRFITHEQKILGSQSLDHPTTSREEVNLLFIAHCVEYIQRCLPGYKVALIPPDDAPEFPPTDSP
jgi:hypothetical protein